MRAFRWTYSMCVVTSIVLVPIAAVAQDKMQVRMEARNAVAQLRAQGEPRDRCSINAELQGANIVTRTFAGSSLTPGDELKSINGIELAGKTSADTIAVLRGLAPDAAVIAVIARGGMTRTVPVTCTNSRPSVEADVLGLDQAADGKFDECAATFARQANPRLAAALMRAKCATLSRTPGSGVAGEAMFMAMRFALEDATYVPGSREKVVEQLHRMRELLTKTAGESRFQELVAITTKWSGGERMFAKSEPNWDKFRSNAEQAVRGRLIDPDSARFEWPYGFKFGFWKPLVERRVNGYVTCGSVNARNRMGGYTGAAAFVVVLDETGSVLFADLGSGGNYDFVSMQCSAGAKKLPAPPPSFAAAASPSSARASSLGDELKKLADLRASGTITDAEFQQAKTRLLAAPPH